MVTDYFTIDSCHSRWVFDTDHQRFRRILKGLGNQDRMTMTDWRSYDELQLDPDSDAFTVVLNEAGTRMLRSWRHVEGVCSQCGATRTEELSVADIAHAEGG